MPTTPLDPRGSAHDDRFFRHLVGSMRNGVICVHRDGTLALANTEALRMFGVSIQPADVGRPVRDVFETRQELVRVLDTAFASESLPNRAEVRLPDLHRMIGYTLFRVHDDEGHVVGAVLFCKDLTVVEQVAERERLRDRLASLGEMAAGIAHELKNPLAAIDVMVGLLKRQVPDDPEIQALLTDLLNESRLANTIVMEMLEYVRPVRLQMEPSSVRDLLHQALTNAESSVPRRGTAVRLRVADALPEIEGDAHQLCRVFTNLMTNAFEALDGQGSVTVEAIAGSLPPVDGPSHDDLHGTAESRPAVVVEVADDGPGIPPELATRIFNPFFTTKITGTGLGLPIVRKIIDAHEGRLDVYSAPDTGARFRVTLPVRASDTWTAD